MKTLERIFVIGFMGTPRREEAARLAQQLNQEIEKAYPCAVAETGNEAETAEAVKYALLDTDKEIERLDGRSLLRLCMTMGEHEYRNKEYELLSKLADPKFDIGIAAAEKYPQRLVVSCGDGIVLDDMCRQILKEQQVVLLDNDPRELWQTVKDDKNLPYAFLHTGTEEEQKAKFFELYDRRKALYNIDRTV